MSLTTSANRSSGAANVGPAPVGTAATRLTWIVALLAFVASVAGLVIEDVYAGPASTAEMFRAYDLVTALVVVPGLVIAARLHRVGSVIAGLVVASLQAALVYTYAYYLFGTGFNDLFLLHVAVFSAALSALVLSLVTFETASVVSRFDPRTPVRSIATLLGLLAMALGGMWIYLAVDNAIAGEVPAGSRLVETDTVVHLGMALDLTLLVPLYALAAVLLWRRRGWGFVLASIALLAGVVHQVGYLVAMPFQVAADIPGAVAYDPGEPVIVLAYGVGAALFLWGARNPSGLSRQSRVRGASIASRGDFVFTIRNMGGLALFLAGTTWLWVTPSFASRDVSTTGSAWALTRVLALMTVVGFCAATYGLFARHGWWEPAALASAVVGLLALVTFSVAAIGGGEATGTVVWNVFVHMAMIGGVFLLLLIPRLENWVDHHVMAT